MFHVIILIFLYSFGCIVGLQEDECEVLARTETGLVCGSLRQADQNRTYASFLSVPYAKQPLGELRFQKLQPAEAWEGVMDARQNGPTCPQTDIFYKSLRHSDVPQSEACIHANIHVPLAALPQLVTNSSQTVQTQLPVFVFIHGGAFCFGSGDTDLHGPEYLMAQDVIVITFNYRLGPLGFLSLNSTDVPGNNGLRDMVTLLQWVQRNAAAFGGNPQEVTIGGESAGATAAHLLSISPATTGLFKRVIVMSGTAARSFYSASPQYAQYVSSLFLQQLGINSTDPEEIHSILIQTPIEDIITAQKTLLDITGLIVFVPVVEFPHTGVTIILDDEPESLIRKGRGKEYPLLIGYNSNEMEAFRPRLEEVSIDATYTTNENSFIPPCLMYSIPKTNYSDVIGEVKARFFADGINIDSIINYLNDLFMVYPSLKSAQFRAELLCKDAVPALVYQFSYPAEHSALKKALNITYKGATHVEDQTFVFRPNTIRDEYELTEKDESMKNWMTSLFVNFIKNGDPTGASNAVLWPAVESDLWYQDIREPQQFNPVTITEEQKDMMSFFDGLQKYIPSI